MAETSQEHQADLDRARHLLNHPGAETPADVEMLARNMFRLDGLLLEMLVEREAVRAAIIRRAGLSEDDAFGLTLLQLVLKVLTPEAAESHD